VTGAVDADAGEGDAREATERVAQDGNLVRVDRPVERVAASLRRTAR